MEAGVGEGRQELMESTAEAEKWQQELTQAHLITNLDLKEEIIVLKLS